VLITASRFDTATHGVRSGHFARRRLLVESRLGSRVQTV
jgi:hypothetical protein